jgi:SP family general alpha glucoside:H+ symporter-like MFS transporter
VFDIACALVDVLPFLTIPSLPVVAGPTDTLIHMLSVLVQQPGGNPKFVPLLMAKTHELLPDLVQDLLEAVEMPFSSFNSPMSPDTRFLYEEEVGRGLYTDLRK